MAPRLTRRIALAALISLTVFWFIWSSPYERVRPAGLRTRRETVEAAFQHAWNGYSKHCMGYDALHPVSNSCDNDFGGWGVSAIDALSTAILMENESVVREILKFIATVDWTVVNQGERIQLFEVAIRHFAGMISAYDLLEGPFVHLDKNEHHRKMLYGQMVGLGDVLSCAFRTPSGVPRNWVDPKKCETDDGQSNTVAGVGTLILEFQRLSDITGNSTYGDLAKNAESFLMDPHPLEKEPLPGILGTLIGVKDGKMLDTKGSWGALSDSYYEYLLKAYIYDSVTFAPYLKRWKTVADTTIQHIASSPYGHPDWTLLRYWEGTNMQTGMDALSWFAGGNFILGGMVTNNQTLIDFGLSIADTGHALYSSTATGLGGEFLSWQEECDTEKKSCDPQKSASFSSTEYILRPELLETFYYAYRATGDPKYKEWTYAAFLAIEKYCKTDSGYAGIDDVTAVDGGAKIDKQESFVYAEVLKYVYLVLLDDETGRNAPFHVQDSRTGSKNGWVLNTEAHPLRVAGPPV